MPADHPSLSASLRTLCAATIDPHLSDRDLVTRFVQQHDQVAFTSLVRRHLGIVWSVCRRMLGQNADIEDAVQGTFLILSRKAAGLKNPELVGAWLYAVARKVALQARKRQYRDRVVSLDPDVSQSPEPLDVLSGREVLTILDEELARLPEEYRAVLLLCCIEGKSREEAAQRLGWSEGSVKGRLERGREMLSRRLSRRGLTLSAVLGTSLVWQTTTASAASLPLATVLAPATPQAVALAKGVGVSLSLAIWAKWCTVAAIAFALVGVGVGVGVESWDFEPKAPVAEGRTQQASLPKPVDGQNPPKIGTGNGVAEPKPGEGDPPAVQPALPLGIAVSGLLRRVDPESRQVVLRIREADRNYRLADGVRIQIDGEAATLKELMVLANKARLQGKLNAQGDEIVILAAEGEVFQAILIGVAGERNTITLRRSMTDPKAAPQTWPVAKGASILLNGRVGTLADLREGDRLEARLSADGKKILAIDVKSP